MFLKESQSLQSKITTTPRLLLFLIIFIALGSILLIVHWTTNNAFDLRSKATNSSLEAENGVRSGPVGFLNDSSVSGGKYVRLNVSQTTPAPTAGVTTIPTQIPTPSTTINHRFGVAVGSSQLTNYGSHIKKYGFNMIVPANVMKMQTIGGCNGNYNFGPADSLLSWANQNNFMMHGHTLVWYNQTSSCAGSFTKTSLKTYITTVMQHYCGKIYSMDVVNEALADSGGYRTDSVWYRLYGGTGYIEDSFRWARDACPSMKLYYNDYSIETYGQAKTTLMLNLVGNLKNKGIIDGVGFQAHWTRTFDKAAWGATIDRVIALGLEFAISEMDVRFNKNYWDFTTADLNLQAQTYKNAADLCNTRAKCHHFIAWGVHDGDSWVNDWEGLADAPLLFTRELAPKPAYCAGVRPVFNLPKGNCP